MIRFIVKASRIDRIGIIKPRWMQEERLLLKTLPIHLASYHPLNSQCQSNWTSQGLGYANGEGRTWDRMEMRRVSLVSEAKKWSALSFLLVLQKLSLGNYTRIPQNKTDQNSSHRYLFHHFKITHEFYFMSSKQLIL